ITELCRRALETGLPVLATETNTYETARQLANLSTSIPVDDAERIDNAMEAVATAIDAQWLRDHLKVPRQTRLSPPAFRHLLSERARAANKRILLPEGDEPRTVQAAIICQQRKLARCVLIGKRADIEAVAASQGLNLPEDMEVIDPEAVRSRYVDALIELRKPKALAQKMAEGMLEDNVMLGTVMVARGEADGL